MLAATGRVHQAAQTGVAAVGRALYLADLTITWHWPGSGGRIRGDIEAMAGSG